MKALTPQERKALAGIAAVALFIAYSVYEIGKRNFWFEAQNIYHTHVKNADGLRVGSVVTISGLRVGEVSALDVDEENNIAVTLQVRRTVASRLRRDSVA
jgi:ABC-type transporter Mla subunit MlaD